MKWTPSLLVALRVLLAPVLLVLVARGMIGDRGALAFYLLAFATDYADGNVARALGVATPRLRAADSAADTVFHLAFFAATWILHGDELRTPFLLAFLATAAAWYGLDAFRWRRVAGFHARSARAFAAALLVWVVALYGFGVQGALGGALAVGTIANVDGLAISVLLEQDQTDVSSSLWLLGALARRTGI
jgi:CDP-diacylglycerol--glycerol-3-phosphate 3-phosphatidyltransferase